MIDLKQLRAAPEQVRAALARRLDPSLLVLLDQIEALDARRRALATELDALKAERNARARDDARHVKEHGALPPAIVQQRRDHAARIADREAELRTVESELDAKALFVPNLPLPELPDGDATCNRVVRSRGGGEPQHGAGRPHWEIAESLGLVDFARGTK